MNLGKGAGKKNDTETSQNINAVDKDDILIQRRSLGQGGERGSRQSGMGRGNEHERRERT